MVLLCNGVDVSTLNKGVLDSNHGMDTSFFVNYVGKGHVGLYNAPTKEESEKLRGERGQIKFIDLGVERWQVEGLRKARRR